MIETLTDIQNILTQIFTNDKPWSIVPTLLTTNSKTTTLTDCVIHQTGMFAHIPSIYSHHSAWLGREVVTLKNSLKFFSPIKQIPVESFFLAVANPASSAKRRTSGFSKCPNGNMVF